MSPKIEHFNLVLQRSVFQKHSGCPEQSRLPQNTISGDAFLHIDMNRRTHALNIDGHGHHEHRLDFFVNSNEGRMLTV